MARGPIDFSSISKKRLGPQPHSMENLKDQPWHQFQSAEVLGLLDVDVTAGLCSAEINPPGEVWPEPCNRATGHASVGQVSQAIQPAACLHPRPVGVLCNESVIVREDGRLKVQGDPTEAALIVAAEKGGLVHADTQRASPRVDMIPFESEHMFRATLHDAQSGRVIYKIGAVERLLDGSSDALGELGKLVHLDKKAVDYAANSNGRSRPSRNCIGPPLHNREPHQARTR